MFLAKPLLTFMFLLGLLVLCLWLVLRPKDSTFTITDISLPTRQNSSLCADGGSIYCILEIKNPNKDSNVFYDNLTLTLHYEQDTVGTDTILHFYQGKDKTKEVLNHFDVKERVWKALMRSVKNSTANLTANLVGGVWYRTWGVKGKYHRLNLQGIITVGSDGKISGKKKKVKLSRPKKSKVKAARFFD